MLYKVILCSKEHGTAKYNVNAETKTIAESTARELLWNHRKEELCGNLGRLSDVGKKSVDDYLFTFNVVSINEIK